MKKSLFLLALPVVALAACNFDGSSVPGIDSLPKGGDVVSMEDSTAVNTFATDMAQVSRKAVTSVGDGFGISGSIEAGISVDSPATSEMGAIKVAVEDFGCDYNFAVSKISGKDLKDVDAAFTISKLNTKLDVDLSAVLGIPAIKAELKNSQLSVYMDNGKLYGDFSDAGIKGLIETVVTSILEASMAQYDTSGWPQAQIDALNSQLEIAKSQMLAMFGDYKWVLSELPEVTIPDFSTALPDAATIAASITAAIDELGTTTFAKLFKAVKYDSGAYGFEVAMDLDLMKQLTASEDSAGSLVVDDYEGLEKFELKLTALTDDTLRLSKVGSKIAFEGNMEGVAIKVSFAAGADFNYAATVTLPTDLATYTALVLAM